jgi:GNAT superfamily N-acetyltransferase
VIKPDSAARPLTPAQGAALDRVRECAIRDRTAASRRIAAVLDDSAVACDVLALVRLLGANTHVALNFHPDRLAKDGRMVADAMLVEGVYRSQFESGISNGSVTAFPGGDRDRFEENLFGGAYQRLGTAPHERPKYGGLNLMNHPDGPCPRFGSCHLLLRPEVLSRTSFSFGDSYSAPTDLGTIDAFDSVLAGLLEATKATGVALGRAEMTVESLLATIRGTTSDSGELIAVQGRALDDYIEAQVHGPIELATDGEAIVADPSFRGTGIGVTLQEIARRYGLQLRWHVGFELDVAHVDAEFRGPTIPIIADHIDRELGDGSRRLHAELVGRAARSVVMAPADWEDWGAQADVLQYLKQLWHVLVHFGTGAASESRSR